MENFKTPRSAIFLGGILWRLLGDCRFRQLSIPEAAVAGENNCLRARPDAEFVKKI